MSPALLQNEATVVFDFFEISSDVVVGADVSGYLLPGVESQRECFRMSCGLKPITCPYGVGVGRGRNKTSNTEEEVCKCTQRETHGKEKKSETGSSDKEKEAQHIYIYI